MIDYPILKQNAKAKPVLGYGMLTSTIECKVTEKRNDAFYLEMKCKNEGDTVKHLQVGRLIRAYAGAELGYQHFRIYDIKKDIEGNIDITAEHVYFDLKKIPVVKNKYIKTHIRTILENILKKDAVTNYHGFSIETDLEETISVSFDIQSVIDCFLGTEGSVLEGVSNSFELIRNDQNIKVLKSRGKFHYNTISYTRNMSGFKCIENRDTAYTHLFPYAFKKIESDSSEVVEDELIICSPKLITMWEYEGGAVNICPRDFSEDVFWESNTLNSKNLYTLAQRHAQKMKSDPPFKYEVDLASIALKADKDFNDIGIGDEFRLLNKMYDLVTTVKVTELTVDSLTHMPLSVVLEQI